jgi:hypothetical protein
MLRRRYDAVAQERVPGRLRNLVERFKGSGSSSSNRDPQLPGAPEQQQQSEQMQQPSSVTCPYCLGLSISGSEGCTARGRLLMCGGRGFLGTIPGQPIFSIFP